MAGDDVNPMLRMNGAFSFEGTVVGAAGPEAVNDPLRPNPWVDTPVLGSAPGSSTAESANLPNIALFGSYIASTLTTPSNGQGMSLQTEPAMPPDGVTFLTQPRHT